MPKDQPTSRDWMDRARCRGYDPELWYDSDARDAQRICSRCPVQAECDRFVQAVEPDGHRTRWGVWAGLTPAQRSQRARRQAA